MEGEKKEVLIWGKIKDVSFWMAKEVSFWGKISF
jgi:hypothetical protein